MRLPVTYRQIILSALDDQEPSRSTDRLLRLVAGRALPGLGATATLHGVEGFLYRRVQHLPGVDPDLMADLEVRHHQRLRWSLRTLADLTRAVDVLARAAPPWLACGGAVLSELLYPQPELRGSVTFDILTSQRMLRLTTEALEESGCRRIISEAQDRPVGGLAEIRMLLWHGTVVRVGSLLTRPTRGHDRWDPAHTEEALARARPVLLHGLALRTLDPTDTLLCLAAASDDSQAGLGRLKDIERAATADAPDWDAFVSRAAAWGASEASRRRLRMARRLLHAPVPAAVLRSLAPSRAGWPAAHPVRRHAAGRPPVETALLNLVSPTPQEPPLLPEPEWFRLVHLAVREHVASLAWAGLRSVGVSFAPESAAELLAQAYKEAATAARHAYATLEGLLRRWKHVGVSPVLLKGPALARSVYSDVALRPFWDLDVLVDPVDVPAVHEVLRDAGYDLAGAVPTAADLTWRHGRGYYDPRGLRPSVDVHWRYLGYPLLTDTDYRAIAGRARLIAVGEEEVRIPGSADQVVMSSIYFVREIWYGKSRLRYLRDLAEVTATGGVDWGVVGEEVGRTPSLRGVLVLGLTLAHRLFGGPDHLSVIGGAGMARSARMQALIDRSEAGLLRPYRVLDSVREITLLRWMADPSVWGLGRWALSLLFVPHPLKPSQVRWLRRRPGGLSG